MLGQRGRVGQCFPLLQTVLSIKAICLAFWLEPALQISFSTKGFSDYRLPHLIDTHLKGNINNSLEI